MGASVSAGADNDDLIDNLVEADYIRTAAVERVFRIVDRADYFTDDSKDQAYKDLAWKYGNVHISAPCIYSEVMENLQLSRGLSFLNLGSGTGYLSTMAGLLLGGNGLNHGIEIHEDVLEYAKAKLEEFMANSAAVDELEFCQPKFVLGNCLNLDPGTRLYDRVYCGAGCPENYENYMKHLIKVGGILVMPVNNQLLQITRISEGLWETKTILPVSFATLITNSIENDEAVKLPDADPLSLQDICRLAIRSILRQQINVEHPDLRTEMVMQPKVRIKKRVLRKFVVPIFNNHANRRNEITAEDINGLRQFGRRGFLMDVQSVSSCRTLLEILPRTPNGMVASVISVGVGQVEGEYDEGNYEDLDHYERVDEQRFEELQVSDNNDNNENNDNNADNNDNDDNDDSNDKNKSDGDGNGDGNGCENDGDDANGNGNDNDHGNDDANDDANGNDDANDNDNGNDEDGDDNDNDVENNAENVGDNAEGGAQENEIDDFARALQGFDNPEGEKGTDDIEMMETDSVVMTGNRATESAGESTGSSTTLNCYEIVTGSSAMTSPTVSTDSTGNISGMITGDAANLIGSPGAMSRMNPRMTSMMSSVMSNRMRTTMGVRVGDGAGARMGAMTGAGLISSAENNANFDNTLGNQILRHMEMGEDTDPEPEPEYEPVPVFEREPELEFVRHPELELIRQPEPDFVFGNEPERYIGDDDSEEKLLVSYVDSETDCFINELTDDTEDEEDYSLYMREKIKLLPLPLSLKMFLNFSRNV